MASLSRVWRIGSKVLTGSSSLVRPNLRSIPCRVYSSTTKKVEQSEFVIGKQTEIDPARVEEIIKEGTRLESDSDASDPTYVTHGFHDDPYWDTYAYRVIFFTTISIVMVFGPAFVHYLPDPTGREWARKEALVVLDERRAAGALVIDPNFIDPSKLVLPEEDPEPLRTA
ncbi:NADH dehydrogenase [ubiquinone] 1 beta subcomplex subunit 11, mitochondrial [Strongylocentrotus purpuratus]|uniref:NADH dehydrogenase [ubiquinone] 1 beta subcomplex subunit 11, mitochondrial n=1 Tax=Strongylocentrotus purpuratus TaxID=7668 RepID=A0A7M7SSP3_STRPU|nr:NADH dehydrogenase [ubiquinone] 1 beta subcomplex subunit 11, mitochondrial-like [Strongylocentrotus purpuratus]XP_787762.1 NADH dehydrogenase [ubiquinone] 1 beta subcomplex subunit 11, mitochondrial [Strongylocentrotus purpuratus]|eukprot:XP_011667987.1 PREDICTED: NADH dehydrogenase [ubiquinone] 1 beta subcomplex subunit 11, mitochondrial isoform X1 [Strongylocentrotus purpuratus]